MSCNQSGKACTECPFSRECPPGALGGSHPGIYLGQILGPFFLPCHMAKNYEGNDTPCTDEHMQCAGAAIFRRKLGVAHKMPDPLLKLDTDDSNVFDSLEEFLMHHDPDIANEPSAARMIAALAEQGYFTEIEMRRSMARGRSQTSSEAQANFSPPKGL